MPGVASLHQGESRRGAGAWPGSILYKPSSSPVPSAWVS